jgi:hypothetical protein
MTKFSHHYYKLPEGVKAARLIAVEKVKLENQTQAFLQYDTFYPTKLKAGEGVLEVPTSAYYPLPEKGDYLLLCFISESGAFFTTLRRWLPFKEEHYRAAIGSTEKIIVKEEEP